MAENNKDKKEETPFKRTINYTEPESQFGSVNRVQSSRDVQGSPWGGGGFVDYGGAAAESFKEGFDQQQKRAAYEKAVKDEEVRELDAAFGELQTPLSGVSGFDMSAEIMGREWKADFADLKRRYDKGEISPTEFSTGKNRLFGNAADFKNASTALQDTVKLYSEAVANGTVSDSTPGKIRDILDTLRKGGETLTVKNIDGVPTLVGKTIQGMDVSTAISDIASGKNTWRFNTKFNTGDALDKLYAKYEKLKVDEQLPDGTVTRRNPSFQELGTRVQEDITNLLNNESTVRAIAGDELGIDAFMYDKNPEEAKAMVANHLTQKLQNEYYPTQQIQQRQFQPHRPYKPNAASGKREQQQQVLSSNYELLSEAIIPNKKGKYPNADGLVGRNGITKVKPFRFSNGFYVYVGDEKYEIYPDREQSLQILANLLGFGDAVEVDVDDKGNRGAPYLVSLDRALNNAGVGSGTSPKAPNSNDPLGIR